MKIYFKLHTLLFKKYYIKLILFISFFYMNINFPLPQIEKINAQSGSSQPSNISAILGSSQSAVLLEARDEIKKCEGAKESFQKKLQEVKSACKKLGFTQLKDCWRQVETCLEERNRKAKVRIAEQPKDVLQRVTDDELNTLAKEQVIEEAKTKSKYKNIIKNSDSELKDLKEQLSSATSSEEKNRITAEIKQVEERKTNDLNAVALDTKKIEKYKKELTKLKDSGGKSDGFWGSWGNRGLQERLMKHLDEKESICSGLLGQSPKDLKDVVDSAQDSYDKAYDRSKDFESKIADALDEQNTINSELANNGGEYQNITNEFEEFKNKVYDEADQDEKDRLDTTSRSLSDLRQLEDQIYREELSLIDKKREASRRCYDEALERVRLLRLKMHTQPTTIGTNVLSNIKKQLQKEHAKAYGNCMHRAQDGIDYLNSVIEQNRQRIEDQKVSVNENFKNMRTIAKKMDKKYERNLQVAAKQAQSKMASHNNKQQALQQKLSSNGQKLMQYQQSQLQQQSEMYMAKEKLNTTIDALEKNASSAGLAKDWGVVENMNDLYDIHKNALKTCVCEFKDGDGRFKPIDFSVIEPRNATLYPDNKLNFNIIDANTARKEGINKLLSNSNAINEQSDLLTLLNKNKEHCQGLLKIDEDEVSFLSALKSATSTSSNKDADKNDR